MEILSHYGIASYKEKNQMFHECQSCIFCTVCHKVIGLEYLLTEMGNYVYGKVRTTSQYANGFQQEH